MSGIKQVLEFDTSKANDNLRKWMVNVRSMTSSTFTETEKMDIAMRQFKNTLVSTAAQIGSGIGLIQLARQIATTRGEFQQLEVAFTTLLQSKAKADALMAESVELAAKTPFSLQDVATGARQLIAYGFAAEEITDTLTRLGNVASGLGLPMERLTYLFGTTMTQGRLYARDLIQFTTSGIPLLQELADMYGVNTDEVNKMVTAGKVGFEDVRRVFENMTNSGGKFYNLMEEQSKTITGRISNLKDAISVMFNEIGKSQEGAINSAISGAAYLVENYEKILKILTVLVATYGVYKASLIAVAAWQKAAVTASSIKAFFELAKGITSAKDAMLLLNIATKANPLGLFLSVITGIITALALFNKRNNEANRIIGEQEQAIISEGREVNALVMKLTNANTKEKERKEALNQLKTIQPSIVEGIDNEANATKRLTDNLVAYNQEQIKRIVLAQKQDVLAEAGKRHEEAGVAYMNREIEAQKQLEAILTRVQSGKYENRLVNNTTESPREGDIKKRTEEITRILNDSTKTIRQKLDEVSSSLFDTTIIRGIGGQGNALRKSKDELTELGRDMVDAELQVDSAMQDVADTAKRLGIEISNSVTSSTSNTTEAISASIKKEIEDAKSDISKFKQELKDLQAGIIPKDAKEGFSFTAAIKEKKEAISDKETALNTLLGIDPKAAAKAGADALKAQNDIDDARLKNLLAAQKERIDAMQDGKAKELAQIEAEKVAKFAAINQEEREMRDKYAKAGQVVPQEQTDTFTIRRKVVNEGVVSQTADVEKKYAKEIEDLYTQIGSVWLTEEEKKRAEIKKTYDGMREELKTLYMGGSIPLHEYIAGLVNIGQAEDQADTKNLLDDYITYTQQREKIEKKFNDDIAEMQAKNADGSFTKNIEEAIRLRDEAIDALNKAMADREGEFSAWADRILNMGLRGLKKALETAKQALASGAGNLSDKERAMLEAKIKALEKQITAKEKGTSSGKQSISDWKDTAQVMNNVATSARNIIDSFDGMDDGLKNVLTSFVNVAEGAGQMATAIAGIGAAVGAAEKASVILLAISAAVSVISGLFSWIGGEDPVEKTRKEFAELNDEIVRLKREADINSWEDTIFGKDEWRNASENMKVYVKAFERYNQTLEDIRKRGQEVYVDFQGRNSDWAVTEKANLDKMAKTWETAAESIYNMQVQTRHSTWFRSAKYASLGDLLPGLFDNGQVNMNALKEFQGSDIYSKLTEENRKLIDNLVADWELYEKALDEVKGYLSDIFGDLGSSMTNALVDAFANGTDAAKAFADSVSDMLENLAKDMIYSVTLAPLFEKAQKDMLDAMGSANLSDEEKFKRYAEILKGVTQDAIAGQDDFNRLLEEYQRIAEQSGLDIFKPEDKQQQATSKGFQAMSQDTGNELNGRVTVMTDIMAKQLEIQKVMKDANLDTANATFNIRDLAIQANNHLSAISNNTFELYEMNRRLKNIETNTAYLK